MHFSVSLSDLPQTAGIKDAFICNGSWMDDALLEESLKPKLTEGRPNVYTYTKAVAEELVLEAANTMPVAIVRPSIITASWKEPFEVTPSFLPLDKGRLLSFFSIALKYAEFSFFFCRVKQAGLKFSNMMAITMECRNVSRLKGANAAQICRIG